MEVKQMEVTQAINIKKVSIDNELKVSVVVEFIAKEEAGKENIFKLVKMQGDIAEMIIKPIEGYLWEE